MILWSKSLLSRHVNWIWVRMVLSICMNFVIFIWTRWCNSVWRRIKFVLFPLGWIFIAFCALSVEKRRWFRLFETFSSIGSSVDQEQSACSREQPTQRRCDQVRSIPFLLKQTFQTDSDAKPSSWTCCQSDRCIDLLAFCLLQGFSNRSFHFYAIGNESIHSKDD